MKRRAYLKLTTIPIIFAIFLIPYAAAQTLPPDASIEPFRLAPGESQTHEMTIYLRGITAATVTRVDFRDGEMSNWAVVDKGIPFSVSSSPESGEDVPIVIPITVTVPDSYTGTGGEISALIDLSYELNGQRNNHAIVQEFTVTVDRPSELWPIFGIGGAIAAAGALYGFYRQRKRQR